MTAIIVRFPRRRKRAKPQKQLWACRILKFPEPRKPSATYCPETTDHNHVLVNRSDNPEIKRCRRCGSWLLPDELYDLVQMGYTLPMGLYKKTNGHEAV